MPIKRCSLGNGKKGWKWGDQGKCYSSRSDAVAQARAAYAAGYREGGKKVSLDMLDTQKEFSAPTSGTSGIAGYDLEGQRRRRRRGAKNVSLWRLLKRSVDTDARDANYSPSRAQTKAGNYKKGKIKISGLDIRIENPAGSTRHGDNWNQFMSDHYGYISRSDGSDGDEVDCFIKPGTDDKWTGTVFVIDQSDQFGEFDEHKVMLGYSNERDARAGYLANYPTGWQGLGAIHAVPFKAFVAWVRHGDTTEPMGAKKVVSLSGLLKGEGPGHEFHGNQWSGGSGNESRDAAIKDKESAAYGGRAPEPRELRSIHHVTSPEAAVKIIEGGFKPIGNIDPSAAKEIYGGTKDGGEFVYFGLSRDAAEGSAVSTGVRFVVNAEDHRDHAVIQSEQEGGIAMIHGPLSAGSIKGVFVDKPDSAEGKRVLQAWDRYKQAHKLLKTNSRAQAAIQEVIDSVGRSARFIPPALARAIKRINVLPKADLWQLEGEGTMAEFENGILQVAEELEIDHSLAMPNVGQGSHNVGDDFRTVVAHELGHALMETMDDLLAELHMPSVATVYQKRSSDYWRRTISDYAATTPHEMIAEALAAYTHPGYSSAQPLPREVVDLFEALEMKPGMRKSNLSEMFKRHGLRSGSLSVTSATVSQ